MLRYETILTTTDFSDHARAGVLHAGELAERMESRLILAHVVDDRLPPLILAVSSEPTEKILAAHRDRALHALAEYADRHLPGQEVETVVLPGIPHDAIVRFAAERSVDLIVMATHGHGFVEHVLAGSTTERVLHHAPCPVLVVPSHSRS